MFEIFIKSIKSKCTVFTLNIETPKPITTFALNIEQVHFTI